MPDFISSYQQKIGERATGECMEIQVINVKGSNPNAPSAYVQASLHGAEVQGNAVIYCLLEQMKQSQPLGNITLVPHCNPLGGNLKIGEYTFGRFDPITGNNWNRLYFYQKTLAREFISNLPEKLSLTDIYTQFRKHLLTQLMQAQASTWGISTGQSIVYFLQSLAHQADIVLDLHTANFSVEHMYVPSYAKESAKYFNMAHYLLIDNKFDGALDEASFCPWWDLILALEKMGYEIDAVPVEAYTLELGSQEVIDLGLAQKQASKILNYLAHKRVIADHAKLSKSYYFCNIADYHTLYSPYGGLYEFVLTPGQEVKKGQLICNCLTKGEIKPIYAPADGRLILHFSSASIPKGSELAKIMTNFESIIPH